MAYPRRTVARHLWYPCLEQDLREELREQAEQADLPLATSLELLLAETHQYRGPYLPEREHLPTVVPLPELRDRAAALTTTEVRKSARIARRTRVGVYSDQPLAEEIRARCTELDCAYSDYLRTVFQMAAGSYDRETGRQLQLPVEEAIAS